MSFTHRIDLNSFASASQVPYGLHELTPAKRQPFLLCLGFVVAACCQGASAADVTVSGESVNGTNSSDGESNLHISSSSLVKFEASPRDAEKPRAPCGTD